ncbi:LacI family transcriptional regulator [Verrucomicrobia bacterium LW23]|nr:LacI family transcriptional regulator [Verrucomicrobia bacterium LW23]
MSEDLPNPPPPKVPEKVTLQSIADIAGVTRALVSMALRNSPRVAQETRLRIRKIADELQYKPNPMVRALMTQIRQGRKTSYKATLAFLTNLRSADYWRTLHTFPEYFRGAQERAAHSGYSLEHFWLGEYRQNTSRFVQMLNARGIPGVLIAPLPHGTTELNVDLSTMSAVTMGYSLATPWVPRVCNHHLQTIETAIQNLAARGYRTIGVALSESDIRQVNHLWIAGLTVASRKYPQIELRIFEPAVWSEEAFRHWFRQHSPEVIVGVTRELWLWTLNLNLAVPDQLGFLHLDCSRDDELSGMYQQTARLGAVATEMLINFVEENIQLRDEESRILLINSEFHEGRTLRKQADITKAAPSAKAARI